MIFTLTKTGVTRHISIKSSIYILAKMLDSNTNREGFCFNHIAALKQHFIGISRAMSRRYNQGRTIYITSRGVRDHASVSTLADAVKPCAVKSLSAKTLDLAEHIINGTKQKVGSDMRLCRRKNILGRTEIAKAPEYVGDLRVVYTRQKLTVGKRACSARAKLYIRFGIKNTEFAEFLISLQSLGNRISAINDDRRIAVFSKQKRAKKTCGSHSDNQGSVITLLLTKPYIKLLGRYCRDFIFLTARNADAHRCVKACRHRINKLYILFLSCIDRAFINCKTNSCRV